MVRIWELGFGGLGVIGALLEFRTERILASGLGCRVWDLFQALKCRRVPAAELNIWGFEFRV